MRKQVQKERCTKIMLTKCKAVCCLYDKVQLAAAKMLDFRLLFQRRQWNYNFRYCWNIRMNHFTFYASLAFLFLCVRCR